MRSHVDAYPFISPSEEHLESVNELLKNNHMLDAWSLAEGSLKHWTPGKARHIAARLVSHLGDHRLAHALKLLNARTNPDNFLYSNYFLYWKVNYLNAYHALDFIDEAIKGFSEKEHRAETLILKARCLSRLHEHQAAITSIDEALEISEDPAWQLTHKSTILTSADKFDEALEAANLAYEKSPNLLSTGLTLSDALRHVGDNAQAEKILLDCHNTYQNGSYASHLQAIYSEQEKHEEAIWSLNEYVRLSPLLSKSGLAWVAGRKADMLIIANKLDEAETQLETADSPFHKAALQKLKSRKGPNYKRKRLNVPFIKQHNMTCAPSTLASIAKYWGDDFNHLEIADAICYDGTPWHKERQWAQNQGYITKEFKFSAKTLYALIDLEIPFTLTTNSITGGHIQACIGYDQRTGVVIMRDPTFAHYTETLIDDLINHHPVEGPRCLLLIPEKQSHLLSLVHFTDSPLYDAYHQLSCAIANSNSKGIDQALNTMLNTASIHPLTNRAKQEVAKFHGDSRTELKMARERCEAFPEIEKYAYSSLYLIEREQGSQAHLEFLNQCISRKHYDPIFDAELGEAYLEKRDTWNLAKKHLLKALKYRPGEARSYASYARYCTYLDNNEEAAKLMRVASTLAPSHEFYARRYFEISADTGNSQQGIDFLVHRAEASAEINTNPTLTLIECLILCNREQDAKDTLNTAIEKHPNDGELLSQASNYFIQWGQPDKGWQLLTQAKGKISEADWHYQAGRHHNFLGNRELALEAYEKSYSLNFSFTNAINNIASIKFQYDEAEATEYLERQLKIHPTNSHLLNILITWHEDKNPQRSNELIEVLLNKIPNNTWAWRQKAINLISLRKYEEALPPAQKAFDLHPNSADSNGILGSVHESLGDHEKALQFYRTAIRLNIDYTWAARKLVEIAKATTSTSVHAGLAFLKAEMEKQVTDGSILNPFWEMAHKYIAPEQLTAQLEYVVKIRPDLWQAHTTLAEHFTHIENATLAITTMEKACNRFPLIPRVWAELARAHKANNDRAAEIVAYEKALQLSPSWDWVGRKLAEAYEWTGELDQSERVLRANFKSNPGTVSNAGMLADLLWKKGDRSEAFETLYNGLLKDYDYSWGWTTIRNWSAALEKDYSSLIKHHDSIHAHIPSWWNIASDIHDESGDLEKALESIDKAIELSPRTVQYWNKKSYYHTFLHQFEEAERACRPKVFDGFSPTPLRVRLAWIRWQTGRHSEALSQINSVIQDDPQDTWAYHEAIRWNKHLGNWDDVAVKANALAKLTPQNSQVWINLGEASIEKNQQQPAIEAFEKAFYIDPTNNYAIDELFKLYLRTDQVDQARDMLDRIEHYQPDHIIALCRTRLAICSNDKEATRIHLTSLLQCQQGYNEDFDEIRDVTLKKNWKKIYIKTVRAEVTSGRAGNSSAIYAWTKELQPAVLSTAKKLNKLPYSDSLKEEAWNSLVEWAVEDDTRSTPITLSEKYPIYRKSTFLWGRMIYLLTTKAHWKKAVDWSADFKERSDVAPWMLVNRTRALIALNHITEAKECAHYATFDLPPDSETGMTEVQYATLAAMTGEEESAKQLTENPHNADLEWGESYKLLNEMILNAQNTEKTSELWTQYKTEYPDWKKEDVSRNLVRAARKRFRETNHKWPEFMMPIGAGFLYRPWTWIIAACVAWIVIKNILKFTSN